jgi:hypothetical protein
LAAYFASVAEAGDLAYMDERRRIRQVIRESTVDMQGDRYSIFDIDAVWELLSIWREWGSVIMMPPTPSSLSQNVAGIPHSG